MGYVAVTTSLQALAMGFGLETNSQSPWKEGGPDGGRQNRLKPDDS
jgi:hypothetical protein